MSIGEGTDERNFLSISLDESLNFIPVVDEFEATYRFLGGDESTLWFFSNLDAPNGKILSLKISNEDFEWQELIQEKEAPISNASIVGNKIVINYLVDTLSRVEFYDLQGNFIRLLSFEGEGTLTGFNGRLENEISYFEFSNFTTPQRIYEIDLQTRKYDL